MVRLPQILTIVAKAAAEQDRDTFLARWHDRHEAVSSRGAPRAGVAVLGGSTESAGSHLRRIRGRAGRATCPQTLGVRRQAAWPKS